MSTTSISVTEPDALVANASASSILCHGGNGVINVTATGGLASYSGVGTYTATAGIHTYTVTDNNGCFSVTSFTLTEPGPITFAQSFTLCQGQQVAVATNNYSVAGMFTDVIASLVNGCDSTISTNIVINGLPAVTVNSGSICAGQSFTIMPNGALTFTYSSGSDVVIPTVNENYTVTGSDVNGCENTAVSTVIVNNLPLLSVNTTNTLLCTGETATLSATGATSYIWSTSETTTDIVVSPTVQTTYTVSGTDANGCSNTLSFIQDVSLCTGIAEISNGSSVTLSLHPNPTAGMVNINLQNQSSDIIVITVSNAIGQIVINEIVESKDISLNLSHFSAGVYIVKTESDGVVRTARLIKQ